MADLNDLQNLMNRAAIELPDKALRIIGVEGKRFISKNFESQGFNGSIFKAWKPRKTVDKKGNDLTKYRTDRRGKRGSLNRFGSKNVGRAILVGHATGGNKLVSSIRYRTSASNATVTFYTAKPYAQRHNEGTDGMPQRQFMGSSPVLNQAIEKMITNELNKIFR